MRKLLQPAWASMNWGDKVMRAGSDTFGNPLDSLKSCPIFDQAAQLCKASNDAYMVKDRAPH